MAESLDFHNKHDRFGGIIIDFNDEKNQSLLDQFDSIFSQKLETWKKKPPRGAVWFVVPISMTQIIPVLHRNGWEYHNAKGKNCSLVKWMNPAKENRVPEFSRARIGVGGVVVDWEAEKVLMIQERYSIKVKPFWKLPGGNLEMGEDLWTCAEREILEETGIRSTFFDLLGFRYLHNIHHKSQDDVYFILILQADSSCEINIEEQEIKRGKWITFEDYFSMKNEEISFKTNTTNIKIRESFKKYVHLGKREKNEKLVDINDVSWKFRNTDLKSIWYNINIV